MADSLYEPVADEDKLSNPRDKAYVNRIADPKQREVVVCSMVAHRRPDKLAPGDPVPALELTHLGSMDRSNSFNLESESEQPLVLIFGSYT